MFRVSNTSWILRDSQLISASNNQLSPFIERSEDEESSETNRSTCISTDNHDCEEVPASDDESEISPD